MCVRVQCARCGKPSWAGCGRHVEQALAGVPPAERCACPRSLLARLFGLGAARGSAGSRPDRER